MKDYLNEKVDYRISYELDEISCKLEKITSCQSSFIELLETGANCYDDYKGLGETVTDELMRLSDYVINLKQQLHQIKSYTDEATMKIEKRK